MDLPVSWEAGCPKEEDGVPADRLRDGTYWASGWRAEKSCLFAKRVLCDSALVSTTEHKSTLLPTAERNSRLELCSSSQLNELSQGIARDCNSAGLDVSANIQSTPELSFMLVSTSELVFTLVAGEANGVAGKY